MNIDSKFKYSIVVPVFKNRESLPKLLLQLEFLNQQLSHNLEVLFVIDGSPDDSSFFLVSNLPSQKFNSQLINLSRNFGAQEAVIAGMSLAKGDFFAVMSADLQDPPETIYKFFKILEKKETDIVIAVRSFREDPLIKKLFANIYWFFYSKFVQPDMPAGGVDLFGFNNSVKTHLTAMNESNSTLIGLLFWIGFRRTFIPTKRLKRPYGKSSWKLRNTYKYFFDSIFSFSELPIKFIELIGVTGLLFSSIFGSMVFIAKIFGQLNVPGYTAIILTIIFFSSLNICALSIMSAYISRSYNNTKGRPKYIIATTQTFIKR